MAEPERIRPFVLKVFNFISDNTCFIQKITKILNLMSYLCDISKEKKLV